MPLLFALLAGIVMALAPLSAGTARAQAIEVAARHALLMDFATGNVLLEKAADTPMPPSSMAKMMTVYIAFEQIKAGKLSLDDTVTVSDSAWRRWAGSEGSLMFLGARETVSIRDLLRGIIVSSGNDACTVLAEALAGTEDGFAVWMNEKAKALGMTNSHFTNASGWPDPDQYVTARDLAILARHTIADFPTLYAHYAETNYVIPAAPAFGRPHDIAQANRNPLLFTTRGADGLKTGHTADAGYGLTGSAVRDGRRLILVVNGLGSERERAMESSKLLEWGFRTFNNYTLFKAGEIVDEAETWLGRPGKLPLVIGEDLTVTLSRRGRANLAVTLVYEGPIGAPVAQGEEVAQLHITAPDMPTRIVPLHAGTSVAKIGGMARFRAALEYFLWGAAGG
ncbi:MAG: D-alanyl-D-alanine carboxypeptidase [Alphaproteobacteria bacterium]|nr:MAG: D-alanyl-D-alanine carboxypeptidase [Alphaproteobacteria bacterium]